MPTIPALRWLHFTDLHVGQPDQGLWPSAKQPLLDDLERTTRRLGPWDAVIFTGDLAFSGKKNEYARLDAELKQIWDLFARVHPGSDPPVLLAVPGNHDLARPKPPDPVADQLLLDKGDGREALWKGEKVQLNTVKKWFREYTAWWERCQLRPKDLTPGLLPGEYACTLRKGGGLSIGFLGMNSSFVQMYGSVKEGQLWMDPRQIKNACGGDPLAWARGHDVAFLLTHHPPDWLARDAKRRYDEAIAPAGTFTAHLCGHLHESLAQQTRAGRGAAREIWQGPSLFGMEWAGNKIDRKHGYTAGHLEITDDGVRTRLWPRLGVKRQDGSWAITADVTYQLEEDLLATPAEPISLRRALVAVPAAVPAAAPSPAAAPPASWRAAVEQSPLWPTGADPTAVARIRDLAARIAHQCWLAWQAAESELPGDPWRDDDFPLRVLDRLAAFVPRDKPSLEEVALLLLAPLVREALFAAGARWMALARPLDLGFKGDHPARKALSPIHAARPDLIRRMEKTEGPDRDAVGFWLVSRAIRQCPQLWENSPKVSEARELLDAIERAAKDAGAHEWLLIGRLVQLARHVGVSPDVFQAEESIDKEQVIVVGGVSLRLSALARVLSAAGAWAMDLRLADDLVADHCGREGFTPAITREALRAARWERGDDVHRLVQTCTHPVVDFVLRDDMVPRAERVLRRLAQDREARPGYSAGLLDRLPPQLRAAITIDKGADGRPRYRVPHVRFQLDHNQIRELLMGEQLYGDPGLAVRELYQNALDACRYREARIEYLKRQSGWPRPPYEGRIAFRQDVDERGRPYIECEDNGVGMTAGILEHVFSVAGKRFKDMPEYLEERARWDLCQPPVELYPNSQFGIGVLSYFMIADEVTVWTRRFDPDARLGGPLVVHISSASGLFRLEEGKEDTVRDGGTRVRLYLNKTSYSVKDQRTRDETVRELSCQRILTELLWVADFATSVQERGKQSVSWQPGVPSPEGHAEPPSSYLRAEKEDVWWVACKENLGSTNHERRLPVLVDGIATETNTAGVLVNLRGPRCGKLSVDRRNLLAWDDAWIDEALVADFPQLRRWAGLTMMFLWHLKACRPYIAERLVVYLSEQHATLPTVGPSNPNSEHVLGYKTRLSDIGCTICDESILPGVGKHEPENLFAAWRADLLVRTGTIPSPRNWAPPSHVQSMPVLSIDESDVNLLNLFGVRAGPDQVYLTYSLNSTSLTIASARVLQYALVEEETVSQVVARLRRYAFLGFETEPRDFDIGLIENICKSDKRFARIVGQLAIPAAATRTNVSPIHLLALSQRTGIDAKSVVNMLAKLEPVGVHVAPCDTRLIDNMIPTAKEALRALSRNLSGTYPWLAGEIAAYHIIALSRTLKMPVRFAIESLRRYEPLGIRVPDVDLARLESLSEEDVRTLSQDADGARPWLTGPISFAQLFRASDKRQISIGEAWTRLAALAWLGLVLPTENGSALEALEHEMPRFREALAKLHHPIALASEVADVATMTRSVPTTIALISRLGILSEPLYTAFQALDPAAELNGDDVIILRAFEDAPGLDRATRLRRGRATARFLIWRPSDADLDAAIARLRPIVDAILAAPTVP